MCNMMRVQAVGGDIACPTKVLALHSTVWEAFFLDLVNAEDDSLVRCPVRDAHAPLSLLLRCMLGLAHVGLLPPAKVPAVLRCARLHVGTGACR